MAELGQGHVAPQIAVAHGQQEMIMAVPVANNPVPDQGHPPPQHTMPLVGQPMPMMPTHHHGCIQHPLSSQPGAANSKSPRWIITRPALYVLEQVFAIEKFPSHVMRQRLAQDLGVTPRQARAQHSLCGRRCPPEHPERASSATRKSERAPIDPEAGSHH